LDFEGDYAGPDETFYGERFSAREPQPRLVPPAKSEPSGAKRTGTMPQLKSWRKGSRPLVFAVHLFEADAHDGAGGLVADEELLFEGPNLPAEPSKSMPLAEFPILT